MLAASSSLFDLHHWIIPATTCDYPFLAVAQDRSALLSLGDYCVSFDWGIPEEAQPWLAHDFAPLGQTLQCELSTVRSVVAATFAGGADFGLVRFDDALRPTHLELGLAAPEEPEPSAEYLILGHGKYQRQCREPEMLLPATAAERTMLEVCVATFRELAVQHGALLRQPLPPRYRGPLAKLPSN